MEEKQEEKIVMVKFLYNECYGGFRLSGEFIDKYNELYGDNTKELEMDMIPRSDPKLVHVFNLLGTDRSGRGLSRIKAMYIPKELRDFVDLHEYDGYESVSVDANPAFAALLFEAIDYGQLADEFIAEARRLEYVRQQYYCYRGGEADESLFVFE